MISKYVDTIKGNLDIFDEACRGEATFAQARRDLFLDLVADNLIPDQWDDFVRVMDILVPYMKGQKSHLSADSKEARFKEANDGKQQVNK